MRQTLAPIWEDDLNAAHGIFLGALIGFAFWLLLGLGLWLLFR